MAKATKQQTEMSKDEQIGYHKGCLGTLLKERAELARMLQIVEQLAQMHSVELQKLGIDLGQAGLEEKKEEPKAPKKKVPIDQII